LHFPGCEKRVSHIFLSGVITCYISVGSFTCVGMWWVSWLAEDWGVGVVRRYVLNWKVFCDAIEVLCKQYPHCNLQDNCHRKERRWHEIRVIWRDMRAVAFGVTKRLALYALRNLALFVWLFYLDFSVKYRSYIKNVYLY